MKKAEIKYIYERINFYKRYKHLVLLFPKKDDENKFEYKIDRLIDICKGRGHSVSYFKRDCMIRLSSSSEKGEFILNIILRMDRSEPVFFGKLREIEFKTGGPAQAICKRLEMANGTLEPISLGVPRFYCYEDFIEILSNLVSLFDDFIAALQENRYI